ncbi:MAG: wax ester/triacylglycerol synthase family O-acyltransferase [Acidimicrobiia bacterium]
MSNAEAIMWAVEKDPALRSDFTNVTVFDSHPDEARLRAKVLQAIDENPRLGQRVVNPPLRLAPPEWRDDPTLDLDYHLRRVALPGHNGLRELLDFSASFAAAPLDRSRPLWEFALVEGFEGDRCAFVQKMHHTITDGVGGLRLSLSLVDFEPDTAPVDVSTPLREISEEEVDRRRREHGADPVDRTSPLDVLLRAARHAGRRDARLVRAALGEMGDTVTHPTSVPGRVAHAWEFAGSVRRQVFVADAARSALLASRSLGRRFEVFSIPVHDATEAAHTLGGTVNDLFVSGVAGALGLYLERMGAPVDELRMAMPVNLREGKHDRGANRFAPSRVLVPVAPKDPATRFALTREVLAGTRQELALRSAESMAGLISSLPTSLLVAATRNQARTIDFATSNLRGSPVDLYMGGSRIVANFPFGPRAGCAFNVTVLSYGGRMNMGLNLDPAAVTDPVALLECFDESFDALLAIRQ